MEMKKLKTFTATELEILLTTNSLLKGKLQVVVSDLANVFISEMIMSTDASSTFKIESGKLIYNPTGLDTSHNIINYIYNAINSFDNVDVVVDYVDIIKNAVTNWMQCEQSEASPMYLEVCAEIVKQTFMIVMNWELKSHDIREIRTFSNFILCLKAIALSEWAEEHLGREFVIDVKTGNIYESIHE